MGSQKIQKKSYPRKKDVECIACQEVFSDIGELREHFQIHTAGISYQCTICLKKMPSRVRLLSHEEIHVQEMKLELSGSDNAAQAKPQTGIGIQENNSLSEEVLIKKEAPECVGHQDGPLEGLQPSANSNDGEKPFRCSACGKRFKAKKNLKEHLVTHTGKNYKCTVCFQAFVHRSSHRRHMFYHTISKLKSFNCLVCQATFRCSSDLREHFRIHVNKSNLVCPLCPNKKFAHDYGLREHLFFIHVGKNRRDKPKENQRTGTRKKTEKDKLKINCKNIKMRVGNQARTREKVVSADTKQEVIQYEVDGCFGATQHAEKNERYVSVVGDLSQTSTGEIVCAIVKQEVVVKCEVDEHEVTDNEFTELEVIDSDVTESCQPREIPQNVLFEVNESERIKLSQGFRGFHNHVGSDEPPLERLQTKLGTHEDLDLATHSKDTPFGCLDCHLKFEQDVALQKHQLKCPKDGGSSLRLSSPTLSTEQPLKCADCHQEFRVASHADVNPLKCSGCQEHEDRATGSSSKHYRCPECHQNFSQASALRLHRKNSHGKRWSLECSKCSLKFGRLKTLRLHLKTCKGRSYECSECHQKFKRMCFLQKHLRTHRGEKLHECHLCQQKFNRMRFLKLHVQTSHRDEKPFDCSKCQQKFKYLGSLLKHSKSHHEEKVYECSVCQQKFYQKKVLRIHMRTSHKEHKPFKCSECHERFGTPGRLRRHLVIHRDKKQSECPSCHLKFRHRSLMRQHLRAAHGQEEYFECPDCHVKFKFSSHLQKHLQVSGDGAFECELCEEEFTRPNCLRAHTKIAHKTRKRFECHVCQQKFRYPGALRKHQLTHEPSSFVCRLCPEKFSYRRDLRSHIKSVHMERKFECNVCHKKFWHSGFFQRHVSSFHAAELEVQRVPEVAPPNEC